VLLTLSTTSSPATDLGYLLHKNPAKAQRFDLAFGTATVFYPEASQQRCTAALMLEVDPVALVRKGEGNFALDQYVNDRPYAASSFLSVAIAQVFGTALAGNCKQRPELAASAIPLEIAIPVLPCRGGAEMLAGLFEPLGYRVVASRLPLDPAFPEWGDGPYFHLTLAGTLRLSDALAHLYVLIPVLDNDKHYWIDQAEVDKLLRHGEGWLAGHPQREFIISRYLKYQKRLQRQATEALDAALRLDDAPASDVPGEPNDPGEPKSADEVKAAVEELVERPLSLNEQRHEAVVAALLASGATSVLDLGCAQGKLLRRLLDEKQFARIVGLDVSYRTLEVAAERLRLDTMPEPRRKRIELLHGSLTYRDKRLDGFDAACLVEVIEHLDPPRLASLERVLFACAKPKTVIVTTPNIEYNVRFPTLPTGKLRHGDHRFEWTRAEFAGWANGVAGRFGYTVALSPIGDIDPEVGSPTQMAVFSRGATT
jgi:3' terminal RNA ribose 2'-O-methyltransferase Hen1